MFRIALATLYICSNLFHILPWLTSMAHNIAGVRGGWWLRDIANTVTSSRLRHHSYPFPFTSAHRTHTLVDSSWWFWSAAVSRRTPSCCIVCHARCVTVPVCGCLPRNQFHTVRSFRSAAVSRGSSHAQGEVASFNIGGFRSAAVSRGFRLQSVLQSTPKRITIPFPSPPRTLGCR